jgi:hypothetical protein
MAAQTTLIKAFEWYRITYGITNPSGKDFAQVEFFAGGTKVGQILFGSAITHGSYVALHNGEIHLYYPLVHFQNICQLLHDEKHLSLYVELDPSGQSQRGGITSKPQQT